MKKFAIPMLVIFACLIMGIVDAVIQPGYIVKSVIKIIMFLFQFCVSNSDTGQ